MISDSIGMPFQATFFDGHTSKGVPAMVTFTSPHQRSVTVTTETTTLSSNDCIIEIIGNIKIVRISLPKGGCIEIPNSPLLTQTLAPYLSSTNKIASWFEKNLLRTFLIVAFSCLALLWVYLYGSALAVPLIKPLLSDSFQKTIGKQTLSILDSTFLEPSTLSDDAREKVGQQLRKLESLCADEFSLTLVMRTLRDGHGGLNAFAIPPSTIVVSDGITKALTPDQLDAVLLHEIGHIKYSHGMDAFIRSSFIAVISLALFGGDPGTIHGLALSVISSQFSREQELAADEYAGRTLLRLGKDPLLLADALRVITYETERAEKRDRSEEEEDEEEDFQILEYISSHPMNAERRKALERLKTP